MLFLSPVRYVVDVQDRFRRRKNKCKKNIKAVRKTR